MVRSKSTLIYGENPSERTTPRKEFIFRLQRLSEWTLINLPISDATVWTLAIITQEETREKWSSVKTLLEEPLPPFTRMVSTLSIRGK